MKHDVMVKRAHFERLARKAAHGNDAALRLLKKAKMEWTEARQHLLRYEAELLANHGKELEQGTETC